MSKERAKRRAEREAVASAVRARRERELDRRARRRALVRKITPRRPDRRVGKLYPRRSRGERWAAIIVFALLTALIWYYFSDLSTRIALTATLAIATPAVIVLAFGKRTH
jgi:hypothetical protein